MQITESTPGRGAARAPARGRVTFGTIRVP